jgi:hypothetical protein
MRSGLRFGLAALAVLALAGFGMFRADDKAEPKYTIKDVMKKGHAGDDSLLKKVTSGNAEADEKKQLLEMYVEMCKCRPPRGEEKEWKEKCQTIIAACKEVNEGKEGAGKKLAKAANCMGCHSVFRAKKK